jgi:uncharacterized membrane protein SpoIIM required for sporulation
MNLERFLERGQQQWSRLDELIQQAKGKPERLGPTGVRELGRLYRVAAADLALARRRWATDPMVARLEALVGVARPLVYDTEARTESLVRFFTTTYWQRVWERPWLLAVATILLLLPAGLAMWWAHVDPAAALGLVPEQFQAAAEPRRGDLGLSVSEQAAFASAIFTNNIRVTFLAFAGGIAAGLGTGFVLIYNGSFLGAVAGLAFVSGNGKPFIELVTAHGVLELSCIIVSAAAGLRMGLAMVLPGTRTRGEALVEEARRAVAIVLGTAPWLVLAGLVEGFVTPAGVGFGAVVGLGVTLGLVYWSLVYFRGRTIKDGRATSL